MKKATGKGKFVSGDPRANKAGRPKGSGTGPQWRTLIAARLDSPHGKMTTREALIDRLVKIGMAGMPADATRAINVLLEREDGKAVQPTTALDPKDCTFVLADPDRRDAPPDPEPADSDQSEQGNEK